MMNSRSLRPYANAIIRGDENNPYLMGKVDFFNIQSRVLVTARISGLPETENGFFGFHIHGGSSCDGAGFMNTGSHFDNGENMHPNHWGDLPPLLYCSGEAYLSVLTDRFSPEEIIGRTVVIHSNADDFTTQPSGNAGEKIACAEIQSLRKK
ncbi:MAG: superoxide dismutase family protein [Ruminococcaceae bacterium]|nr:superoxide dismutase family protein [Oscillospiraceae bacterium]MBQ7120202.1 superoxide dismutase family protein [Oscillospiraceae bacterium]